MRSPGAAPGAAIIPRNPDKDSRSHAREKLGPDLGRSGSLKLGHETGRIAGNNDTPL
jgi:hypothetical protein